MEAVILAAGLGTRLRPHTPTTPKPLLPVQGRPILDWSLGSLPSGVERVVIVTHYLAEQVDAYLASQTHFKHWTTVFQEKPRRHRRRFAGLSGAARSDHFLVLNGDDLFGAADLAALARHRAGVLTIRDERLVRRCFLEPAGTLDRLVEKPDLDGRQLANTGALRLSARSLRYQLRYRRTANTRSRITSRRWQCNSQSTSSRPATGCHRHRRSVATGPAGSTDRSVNGREMTDNPRQCPMTKHPMTKE